MSHLFIHSTSDVFKDDFMLDISGFQFLKEATRLGPLDFEDDEVIKNIYYPEQAEIIKRVTGASKVLIFNHCVYYHLVIACFTEYPRYHSCKEELP